MISQENINLRKSIIETLNERNLSPKPLDKDENVWVSTCPANENHYFEISTRENEWNCKHCEKKGQLSDFAKWLRSINMANDQASLSKMMEELSDDGSMKSDETIAFWMNRY